MNSAEYREEIEGIAANIACEAVQTARNDDQYLEQDEVKEAAEELINDSMLHETIDGHEWIIYNGYNLDVIKHRDNDDYMADNFGGDALAESLKSGLSTLHCNIAFWCMYADVQECIDNALDNELDD